MSRRDHEHEGGPLVSVVVPTFDEERELPVALDHLASLRGRWEVVIADGGSSDRTAAIARERGVGVIAEGDGRPAQLNAAARATRGEVLVFVHADSRLPAGAYDALCGAIRDPHVVGGNFVLRFTGDDRFAFFMTFFYWLHRRMGRYYGDSSVWVRRDVFERLGGYRPVAFMDDFDFVRRLEAAGPTACLPGPAVTSPRRWRRLGLARTILSWTVLRVAFRLGASPGWVAGFYERVR